MDGSTSSDAEGSGGDAADGADTIVVTGTAHSGGGADAAPRLERGTTVGRYVILDVVGSGGMGVVYSAFDPELDRKVALKLLRPEARVDAGSERARDRLLREAQAMARLSHPNVLPVFDVGTYRSSVFVALEFVDGETLRAWIDRTKPPWSKALPVMISAARGLAAAHAEGLVHRDFKPENVLIGRRGDVRVMDFGLARNADEVPAERELELEFELDVDSGGSTRTDGHAPVVDDALQLTRSGFVLGTPAYMAPEQHRGGPVDARADQFAYCVTLYQAVYGERPFAGRLASELVAAAVARAVRPPPRGLSVPWWLRRAILRGLAPDPAARWPDMNALRAELSRDRRGRRRIGGLVLVTAAAAVAGGFAYGRSGEPDSPCEAHAADLDAVWNLERRTSIATGFAATGLPYAPETWTRVEATLDGWVDAWIAARIDACEATRVREEQSETTMEMRGFCLERRRAELDGLLGVFAVADAVVVERAVAGVAALDPPTTCDGASALGDDLPRPSPAVVAEVERLRAELARAQALRSTARYGEALELAVTTRDAAMTIDYPPLLAEARLDVGTAMAELGQLEAGVAEITAAIDLAEAQGMDLAVARGEAKLVELVGAKLDRRAEGERWAQACAAKLRRIGGHDRLEAQMLMSRASVADAAGDYDTARRHALAAIELWNRVDATGPERALALGNLGRVAFRAQDFQAAFDDFERAREAAVAAYGPRHPEIAKLMSNSAAALHGMGQLDRAGKTLDESLALLEAALPPDHPDIAVTLTNISAFAYRSKRYEYAIEVSQRVIDMRRRVLGPKSPKIAASLNNQAISLLALDRLDEALERFREAVALYDEGFPAGHPDVAALLAGVGEVLLRKGDHDGAAVALERGVRLGDMPGVNPYAIAESKFLLATALWDAKATRDRPRALEVAAQAAETLRGAPAHERKHLEEIETWLGEHSP